MSADTRGETDQEAEREAARVAYDRVVETLRQQTGGSQPAAIAEAHLRQVCCSSGSLDVRSDGGGSYESALRAAIEQGDVVEWHSQLVLAEEELLRAAIEEEVEAEITRKAWIGTLNTALAGIEDGDRHE